MKRLLLCLALLLSLSVNAQRAQAFCGFYVAKADTKIFNKDRKSVV